MPSEISQVLLLVWSQSFLLLLSFVPRRHFLGSAECWMVYPFFFFFFNLHICSWQNNPEDPVAHHKKQVSAVGKWFQSWDQGCKSLSVTNGDSLPNKNYFRAQDSHMVQIQSHSSMWVPVVKQRRHEICISVMDTCILALVSWILSKLLHSIQLAWCALVFVLAPNIPLSKK